MDAAAMPFPKRRNHAAGYEDVFSHCSSIALSNSILPRTRKLIDPFQILRRIHAQRFVFGFDHADLIAVFERAQLLQPLGLFERADRQVGIAQQKIAPVDVQADMFEVRRTSLRPSRSYGIGQREK